MYRRWSQKSRRAKLFRRSSDFAMRLPERVIDCDNDLGDLDRSEKGYESTLRWQDSSHSETGNLWRFLYCRSGVISFGSVHSRPTNRGSGIHAPRMDGIFDLIVLLTCPGKAHVVFRQSRGRRKRAGDIVQLGLLSSMLKLIVTLKPVHHGSHPPRESLCFPDSPQAVFRIGFQKISAPLGIEEI